MRSILGSKYEELSSETARSSAGFQSYFYRPPQPVQDPQPGPEAERPQETAATQIEFSLFDWPVMNSPKRRQR